jgi:hypothetical protein
MKFNSKSFCPFPKLLVIELKIRHLTAELASTRFMAQRLLVQTHKRSDLSAAASLAAAVGRIVNRLCSVLDGYSRSIVHWDLRESMKEAEIEMILERAKEKAPRSETQDHLRQRTAVHRP